MVEPRKLRVFLCHASQDKPMVRELCRRLLTEGWIDPWLDEEKLLPGQDWDLEIKKALSGADAVTVCLSANSISREGYVQKEINSVLEKLKEKPEDSNYFIPVRLEDCKVPTRLQQWQYVDFFPIPQKERAYAKILAALRVRADILGLDNIVKIESISVQKALIEFGQEIALTILLPTNQILEFFRSKASKFLNTDNMFVALREDDGSLKFELVYEDGIFSTWPIKSASVGRTGEVLRTNNSIFLSSRADIEQWFRERPNEKETAKMMCWLGVPMLVRNEAVGVVGVFHPNKEYVYNVGDLEVLETLANLAGIALNNARLYEQARKEVIAAKKLSAVGSVMAALQHRINNTLNIIIPNVHRLRSRMDLNDPVIAEVLDIIERNARYTSTIVARVQGPFQEADQTDININTILDDIVLRKRRAWSETTPSAQIVFIADERIPGILGPGGQIAEIFGNLIDNAYGAMPSGGEIRVVSQLSDDNIVVKVTDSGRGIPQEIQARLFEKPVPSRYPGAGAGLGLWLSRLILQTIGGDIKIESSNSAGTTISVIIPVP